jgi:3,4-dihydroxy 2-butanone 4-phosphate synthase/GTP cyclohydrolase II
VYESTDASHRQFLALVAGEADAEAPTLVRMHPGSVFADLFAPANNLDGRPAIGGGAYLFEAMRRMEREGRGVVVYFPPTQTDLLDDLRALAGEARQQPHDLVSQGSPAQREHGLGAQILMELGLRKIRLVTSNPRRLVGLAGYGLEVVDMVDVSGATASRGDAQS